MPFVIGVFKEADNRSSGAHEFRKLPLREPGLGAKLENLSGNRVVGPCLLKVGLPLGFSLVITTVEDFNGVLGRFSFLGHFLSLLMRVLFRVLLIFCSVLHGAVDLLRRYSPLFDKAVGKDDSAIPVKEVKHPVVYPLEPHTKLINPIPEEVGLGSPEFVAQFTETLNLHTALVLGLRG